MTEPSSIYFTMREEPSSTNSSIFARISSVQSGRRSVFRNPFGRTNYQRSSSIYSRPIDFNFNFDLENAPPVPPVPPLNPRHERNPSDTTPRLGFADFFPRREEEPLPPCPPMMTDFAAAHRAQNHSRQVSPLIGSIPSTSSSPSGLSSEWRAPSPVQPMWANPMPEVLEDTRPVGLTRSLSSDRVPLTATTRQTDETLTDEREARRKQRKRKRKHHRTAEAAWVRPHRRGTGRGGGRENILHRGHYREKNIYVTSIVAGLFLLATVATYVTIALTVKGLGQELHILFAITIVAIFLFLIHALITLRSNLKRRATSRHTRRDHHGYKPSQPIRVHMGVDEEQAAIEKLGAVKPPPPAYGLWRSSVRVNPQLLFWQKVHGGKTTAPEQMAPQNISHHPAAGIRRPPSYASDDGVSYIMEAAPRSTVNPPIHPPMDQHPAFRF